MGMLGPLSFQDHFASLTDLRSFHARRELRDPLVAAICVAIGLRDGKTFKDRAKRKRSGVK